MARDTQQLRAVNANPSGSLLQHRLRVIDPVTIMFSTSNWTTRLAVLGALAGATICAKALRLLYLWAELELGPVRLQRFKRDWALVTGGACLMTSQWTAETS